MYDSLGKTMQVTDSAQNVMTMFGKMRKALYKNTPEHYALVNDKYTPLKQFRALFIPAHRLFLPVVSSLKSRTRNAMSAFAAWR